MTAAERIAEIRERLLLVSVEEVEWLLARLTLADAVVEKARICVGVHDQTEGDHATWQYFFDKAMDRQRAALAAYDADGDR